MADAAVDKKEVVAEEEVVKKVEKEVEKVEDSDKVEGENGSGDKESHKENGEEKASKESAENGDSDEVAPTATKRKSVGESGDGPDVDGESGDDNEGEGETPEKKAKIEEKVATPTKVAEDKSANGEAEAVA